MKALLVDIDGIINKYSASTDNASVASQLALDEYDISVPDDLFTAQVMAMNAAYADDPFIAAMWYFFRPQIQAKGYDRKHQQRAWRDLLRARRSHLRYRFRERDGIRELLEEVRFGCVDSHGDVPKIIAMGRDGEFAKNAIEVDGLTPLFDAVMPCEDFGLERSDPRYSERVLAAFDLTPDRALMISDSLRPLALGASLAGATTLLLLEGSAAMGFEAARRPQEEPSFVVSTFDELCEGVVEWLNAPTRVV